MELLRTPRLLLRHWEEPDLPAFFDLYSREDVMRWLGPHPRRSLTTLDEARERLARWRAREPEAPLGLWAVVPLAPGTPSQPPAGTVLLMPLADADGPTGLIEQGNSIVIAAGAPHPAMAALWVNWLLSKTGGQPLIAASGRTPLIATRPSASEMRSSANQRTTSG